MTYNVSSATLNPTIPYTWQLLIVMSLFPYCIHLQESANTIGSPPSKLLWQLLLMWVTSSLSTNIVWFSIFEFIVGIVQTNGCGIMLIAAS